MIQRAGGTLEALVHAHLEALHTSSWISSHFKEHYQRMATDVKPERVIEVLYEVGIKCVLMGTYGLNVYRDQARATQDVDVLVRKKEVSKAVRALRKAFPELVVKNSKLVTRFVDPGTEKVVLDVMKPLRGVLPVVFRHLVPVGDTHCIPDLEMALASKFAAMMSPLRQRLKRAQDLADFMNVVVHNRQALNLKSLQRLGNKAFAGGGEAILQLVDDIDTGRPIEM